MLSLSAVPYGLPGIPIAGAALASKVAGSATPGGLVAPALMTPPASQAYTHCVGVILAPTQWVDVSSAFAACSVREPIGCWAEDIFLV